MIGGSCTGIKNEPIGLRTGKFVGAVGGTGSGGYLAWHFLSSTTINPVLQIVITLAAAGFGNQVGRGIGAAVYTVGKNSFEFFSQKCGNGTRSDYSAITDITEEVSSTQMKSIIIP